MYDIRIFKTPDYMHDCVDLTDICKKLVSKPLSLGRAFYKSCDIDKLDSCRDDLFCMIHLPQYIQSLIRHCHYAYIRIYGTERIVGRFRSRLCQ